QPEIKALSSRRVNKVHPPNDIALTACLPLLDSFLPHKAVGKVKIGAFLCTLQGGICREPLCESSLFDGVTIHDFLKVIILIKMDSLLVFKMDRQAIDGGF